MKKTQVPAIEKYLGWWVVTPINSVRTVGQIIEVDDAFSVVQFADFDDVFANTALLDSRIAQIYPSRREAMKAVEGRQ